MRPDGPVRTPARQLSLHRLLRAARRRWLSAQAARSSKKVAAFATAPNFHEAWHRLPLGVSDHRNTLLLPLRQLDSRPLQGAQYEGGLIDEATGTLIRKASTTMV